MPVYHENAAQSLGLLTALAKGLEQTGIANRAEVFVLSDSRDPAVAVNESLIVAAARDASPVPIWYRRRETNEDRKSGNLAEFIRRWGGRYDQMVVLDADSVLSAETIRDLSARMNADPDLGLIQTMPILVGGETIFARLTQFAGRVYGPMIARGVSAWSGDTGNYWGHNAIIRVAAFAQACGWTMTCAAATRVARRRCWTWPRANAAGRRAICNMRASSGSRAPGPSAWCISP